MGVTNYVDHDSRLIIVTPLDTDPISPDWIDNCLRKGGWTAYIENCRESSDGKGYIHSTNPSFKATLWQIIVGGEYNVSDQPPINNRLPPGISFGSSITYVVYFDNKVYAQRLAQRALDLWIIEYANREEKRKEDRIKRLESALAAYQKENDSLWQRYLRALERTPSPNLSQ